MLARRDVLRCKPDDLSVSIDRLITRDRTGGHLVPRGHHLRRDDALDWNARRSADRFACDNNVISRMKTNRERAGIGDRHGTALSIVGPAHLQRAMCGRPLATLPEPPELGAVRE